MSTLKFCTECGAKVEPGLRFCVMCGTRLADDAPPARVCPNGCTVDDPEQRFCIRCGAPLVLPRSEPPSFSVPVFTAPFPADPVRIPAYHPVVRPDAWTEEAAVPPVSDEEAAAAPVRPAVSLAKAAPGPAADTPAEAVQNPVLDTPGFRPDPVTPSPILDEPPHEPEPDTPSPVLDEPVHLPEPLTPSPVMDSPAFAPDPLTPSPALSAPTGPAWVPAPDPFWDLLGAPKASAPTPDELNQVQSTDFRPSPNSAPALDLELPGWYKPDEPPPTL